MRQKLLIITSLLTFFFQIIFSIYYSQEIIDENTKFDKNQNKYSQLVIINQNLEKIFFQNTSISNLKKISQDTSLIDITNNIDLNQ